MRRDPCVVGISHSIALWCRYNRKEMVIPEVHHDPSLVANYTDDVAVFPNRSFFSEEHSCN